MDTPFESEGTPSFHPVWERSEQAWFPGDDGASLLVAAEHTWSDIQTLLKMRSQRADDYERKLLFKYVVIELRSMIVLMDALRTKVMAAGVYERHEEPLYRGISREEREAASRLWRTYSKAKGEIQNDLIAFRNRIGAHRDSTDWQLWKRLWDEVSPEKLRALFNSIPPAFNHAKDLNIYEWNRRTEDGAIEILAGPVGPWLFESNESD